MSYIRHLIKDLHLTQKYVVTRMMHVITSTITSTNTSTKTSLCYSRRFKGHSQWFNRKFKKMHIDRARAKAFGKLSMDMITAVKEGGGDPDLNPKLGELVKRAKQVFMPKLKIEESIKSGLRDNTELPTRFNYFLRGPGRCALLVDVVAPKAARAKSEISRIIKKEQLVEDQTVVHMFSHKGVFTVEACPSMGEIDEEKAAEAEEIAIMIGAEDCIVQEDYDGCNVYHFICSPKDFYEVEKNLVDYRELKVLSSEIQYLGKILKEQSEENMEAADSKIEVLTNHPDVFAVYDNIVDYPSKTIKLSQ